MFEKIIGKLQGKSDYQISLETARKQYATRQAETKKKAVEARRQSSAFKKTRRNLLWALPVAVGAGGVTGYAAYKKFAEPNGQQSGIRPTGGVASVKKIEGQEGGVAETKEIMEEVGSGVMGDDTKMIVRVRTGLNGEKIRVPVSIRRANGEELVFDSDQIRGMERARDEAIRDKKPTIGIRVMTTKTMTELVDKSVVGGFLTAEQLANYGIKVVVAEGSRGIKFKPEIFKPGGLMAEWSNRRPETNLVIVTVLGGDISRSEIPAGAVPDQILTKFSDSSVTSASLKADHVRRAKEIIDFDYSGVVDAYSLLSSGTTSERDVVMKVRMWAGSVATADALAVTPDIYWANREGIKDGRQASGVTFGSVGKTGYFVVATGIEDAVFSRVTQMVVAYDPLGNPVFADGSNEVMHPARSQSPETSIETPVMKDGQVKFTTRDQIVAWGLMGAGRWSKTGEIEGGDKEFVDWVRRNGEKPGFWYDSRGARSEDLFQFQFPQKKPTLLPGIAGET
jgi:hypothetical protein